MLNPKLLQPEIQDFIRIHTDEDPARLMLKGTPFPGVDMRELAEQIRGRRTCRQKLPAWYGTEGLYYPPALSLEQSSSEWTARYKGGLFSGRRMADITGGAGVDSWAFAQHFSQVRYMERSSHLCELAAHNLPLLGAVNVSVSCGDGLELLKEEDELDLIYLDPSRRSESGKKVFQPQEYEPDFMPQLDFLLSKAPRVLIKTSPLIDIRYGILHFRYVSAVHVVALRNECKEILWVLERESAGSRGQDVPLPETGAGSAETQEKGPMILCAETGADTRTWAFRLDEEDKASPAPLSAPGTYLYEPWAAILKAGAFKSLAWRMGLAKLHPSSHLYTSNELIEDFPGRVFRVMECLSVKEFGKRYRGGRIHLSTRNFPVDAPSLMRKFRITAAGNDYAFFTTVGSTGKSNHLVLRCEKAISQLPPRP